MNQLFLAAEVQKCSCIANNNIVFCGSLGIWSDGKWLETTTASGRIRSVAKDKIYENLRSIYGNSRLAKLKSNPFTYVRGCNNCSFNANVRELSANFTTNSGFVPKAISLP